MQYQNISKADNRLWC